MKIAMEISTLLLSVVSILLSAYTFIKNYNEIIRKNSIDIMPFFDIDIFNIQIWIDVSIKRFYYSIPLFNLGNGGAKNIVLKNENLEESFIGNNFSLAKTCIFYNISGDIATIIEREKKIQFMIEYEDFNNKKYRQEFELKIRVSRNYLNLFQLGRTSYFNNFGPYNLQNQEECIFSYFLSKNNSFPLEIK